MKVQSEIDTTIRTVNKKVQKSKVHGSAFIITINTNKTYNSADEKAIERLPAIRERFTKLLQALFSESNLPKIIQEVYTENGVKKFRMTNKLINIKARTDIEANIENRGFLHSHTYIQVVVRDVNIQVNMSLIKPVIYAALKDVLTVDGKFKKPYVSVKGERSSEVALEAYLGKYDDV